MFNILRNALVISKISFRNRRERFKRPVEVYCNQQLEKLFQPTINSPTRTESSVKCSQLIMIIRSEHLKSHSRIFPCLTQTIKSIKSRMKSTQSLSTGKASAQLPCVFAQRHSHRKWKRHIVIDVVRYSVTDASTSHYPCLDIRAESTSLFVVDASKCCHRSVRKNETLDTLFQSIVGNFTDSHTLHTKYTIFNNIRCE